MSKRIESESRIQQSIVVFFRNNYQRKGIDKGLIFSVPNERTGGYQAMRPLLLTGLLSGVSDLIVVLEGRVIFVEVKNSIGKQSDKQKLFETQVENLGFEYHVVRTLNEFILILNLNTK